MRLPFFGWESNRAVALVVATLCALGSGAVVFLFVVFVTVGSEMGDVGAALPMALVLAAVVGGGLAFAAMAIWAPWSGRRAELVVDSDVVTVIYPGLGSPLVVPRAAIREVVFGPVDTEMPRLTLWGRLAIPNVSILFRSALPSDSPRWLIRAGVFFHRLWCGGGPVSGVQCRVVSEEDARRAFAE